MLSCQRGSVLVPISFCIVGWALVIVQQGEGSQRSLDGLFPRQGMPSKAFGLVCSLKPLTQLWLYGVFPEDVGPDAFEGLLQCRTTGGKVHLVEE